MYIRPFSFSHPGAEKNAYAVYPGPLLYMLDIAEVRGYNWHPCTDRALHVSIQTDRRTPTDELF